MDYRVLVPASLRAEYVRLTDSLIADICQIAAEASVPVRLLFLDKSGRPVAWLVRALWPLLARRPGTGYGQGVVPRLPSCHFANIDREQWWHLTGASETGDIAVTRVPADVLAGLRGAFLTEDLPDPSPAAIAAAPTFLDDCVLVVIDEVCVSGDTLTIARGLVEAAFPSSQVHSRHFMTPGLKVDKQSGQRIPAGMPVWYSDATWKGRLVGDRRASVHRGTHWRGRVGIDFLSTSPAELDILGRQLRAEIGSLPAAMRAGQLLARPAGIHDLDEALERIEGIYGYTDVAAFTAARAAQDQH